MEKGKELSQVEYDLEMNRLHVAQDEEYRKIDQRRIINSQRLEFLLKQRKDIVAKMYECKNENQQIDADKNDIARRYHEKMVELRKRRNETLNAVPKEISSTVAYRLHCAVEKALKAVLAPFPNVNLEAIKCNYNYDDGGGISFDVIIPTYDEGQADQA